VLRTALLFVGSAVRLVYAELPLPVAVCLPKRALCELGDRVPGWRLVEHHRVQRAPAPPPLTAPPSHPRHGLPRPKANLSTRTDTRNRVRTDPVDEAGSVTLRVEHGVRAAVDVALLGRFYERFADHAVEVGRRVVLIVTGALPPRMTSARTERRTPGRPPSAWRSRSLRRPKRPHRPGFANPLDRAPGWLDLRPGRVLHGSATPSASPSRLGVPGRPRSSPRSQSPKATQPPGPATGPVGVGESC
jgi:hypothetical protein